MTKARDLANIGTTLASVSTTELGYLDGVTSAIQTQIDGKQAANAAVSTTELGYLDGVTSAIQTQLDGKSGTSHNHDSTYIAKTLTTTTGDMIYASSANTPARLAIGSSSQVLTVSGGVPTWATPAGGGKVLQVVHASYATSQTSTTTTFADTGLTATITPNATSSKVLVLFTQNGCSKPLFGSGDGATLAINLVRGSTELFRPAEYELYTSTSTTLRVGSISGEWLDSPSTTSATTYKTQFANSSGNNGQVNVQQSSARSTMVLLEIGA